MKITSKILAFLLAAVMCIGLVPVFASAASAPAVSLIATAVKKDQIEVSVRVNDTYLTSAQLYVKYDSGRVAFAGGQLTTGSSADICVFNDASSQVAINFASVNTVCTNKAFVKLNFTIKAGATGKCAFSLAAKNCYFATGTDGDGVKTTSVTLTPASCSVPSVKSLTVTSSYTYPFFIVGSISSLDMSKFKIKATYTTGDTETIPVSACKVIYLKNGATTTFDGKSVGNYICRFTYKDCYGDFIFIVGTKDAIPSSVTISAKPTKLRYLVNSTEKLDLSGLVLSVKKTDGKVETVNVGSAAVDGLVYSGFDITAGGKQTITLNYKGKSATYEIMVGYLKGDIDNNGSISSADARLALRCAVKLETFNEVQEEAADVDHSGTITSADARLILRYAVKLETSFD